MTPSLRKKSITENCLVLRSMRYFDARNQLLIRRATRTNLGPLFVLDLDTGAVIERGIPSLVVLAKRHGLLKRGEVLE